MFLGHKIKTFCSLIVNIWSIAIFDERLDNYLYAII